MSAEAATVRVTIFGEDYQIRTDLGEEYTRECAVYVDEAIQEAHVGGHVTEPHKAAILAALKITDEMFRARAESAGLTETVRTRVLDLASRLEAASGGGDSGDADDNVELALD
ncbi:MAG: cell division protein ZapA [Gemmatimonadota bacterium]|nr:cell division protein ZapA [Gemmatimonadota bacterium]